MDKYRFAACDDEEAIRNLIAGWLSKSPYEAEIKEYDSGEELIRDIDAGIKFDILFLDIAMGGTDGIDTARELGMRVEKNGSSMRASRPLIIYVTGIPDRMGDAFGVKAYDYLLKPVSQPVFEGELRRAVEELKRLDAQLVCETRYSCFECASWQKAVFVTVLYLLIMGIIIVSNLESIGIESSGYRNILASLIVSFMYAASLGFTLLVILSAIWGQYIKLRFSGDFYASYDKVGMVVVIVVMAVTAIGCFVRDRLELA